MALEGRTALVIGFAGAIGSAIAISLANAGSIVIGVDKAKQDTVQILIDKIKEKSKHDVRYFECDLSKKENIHRVFQDLKSGGVDILVNAAGRISVSNIEALADTNWEDDIAVNLTAPFMVIKHFLGSIKEKGWGRIINISSTCGLVALPNISSYIASKSGLIGLTRAVAVESAKYGVTCNAICPTTVDTPFIDPFIKAASNRLSAEKYKAAARSAHPTKQFTDVDQIAALVLFLCSPAGKNITGTAIPMDGGITIT